MKLQLASRSSIRSGYNRVGGSSSSPLMPVPGRLYAYMSVHFALAPGSDRNPVPVCGRSMVKVDPERTFVVAERQASVLKRASSESGLTNPVPALPNLYVRKTVSAQCIEG